MLNEIFIYSKGITPTPGYLKKTDNFQNDTLLSPLHQKHFQELVFKVFKGWFPNDRRRSQTIADRRSQIADDRKESCFHIIADDRKRSQSRLLHTFRTAEVSKLHARCASEKIAANNMAYVEGEILLQANLFFF